MKKKVILIVVFSIIALGAILFSLFHFSSKQNSGTKKHVIKETQLAPIKKSMQVEIFRYEKDLFGLDLSNLADGIEKLSLKYPEELIQKGCWEDAMMMTQLKHYLEDPVIREIYNDAMNVFPDMNDFTKEMENAFSYYLFHYPESVIPAIYTIVPGLDFSMPSVYAVDNNLFIHLDMYLGHDYKNYNQYGVPKYISERCDKKYMGIDCFKKALVYKHLPSNTLLTLLDHILCEGKKLYFTEIMFPERSEQDIIGYQDAKYKWALDHQFDVWNYMIEKEQLFSKNDKEITNYTSENPFTKPFTNDSPGRMGSFIGWKIIQSYMRNNPEITIDELMQNTNSQSILNLSKYKPKRR